MGQFECVLIWNVFLITASMTAWRTLSTYWGRLSLPRLNLVSRTPSSVCPRVKWCGLQIWTAAGNIASDGSDNLSLFQSSTQKRSGIWISVPICSVFMKCIIAVSFNDLLVHVVSLVDISRTRHTYREDSHLHNRCHNNLVSQLQKGDVFNKYYKWLINDFYKRWVTRNTFTSHHSSHIGPEDWFFFILLNT